MKQTKITQDAHPAHATMQGSIAWMTQPGNHIITQTKPKTNKQQTDVHYMASDGSVKYQKGTFGYVWKNKNKETIHTGCGWVRGNIETMNSFRAEAQGMAI